MVNPINMKHSPAGIVQIELPSLYDGILGSPVIEIKGDGTIRILCEVKDRYGVVSIEETVTTIGDVVSSL